MSDEAERGLPPNVSAEDVPADQKIDEADPGLPKAPVISNEPPPETKVEEEEKAPEEPEKKEEDAPEVKDEEDEKVEDDQPTDGEYVEYGHPAADAAVALLKAEGVEAKEAATWFAKAVETGDIKQIDVAAIEAKLGKDKAALIVSAVGDYYNGHFQTTRKTVERVYQELGSKENLETVVAWANKEEASDPEFKEKMDDLRKMFDLGANSAALAARELRALYEAAPGNSALEVKIVQGDGAGHTPSGDLLSREDYLAKVKEANSKGDAAEVERLRKIRLQSIGKV